MNTETKEKLFSVSFGNKKLPKTTAIFNLPAVITCPLKTVFCASHCYALKAERQYKNVVPQARENNLKWTRDENFTSEMIKFIEKNRHKIQTFRIHESGDFYSQTYFNKWTDIARMFPIIVFYAYTKSFHLEYYHRPSNFKLIASFDESTDELRMNKYREKASQFDNTFSIVGKENAADCIQDCTKCSNCWMKSGQAIRVNLH